MHAGSTCLVSWVLCRLVSAGDFATIAYLLEYRHGYDIESAVKSGLVSDVVLFSVEVAPGGGVQGEERLPSQERVSKLRSAGARVHLCIGGAGRSAHFEQLADAKVRKRTVLAALRLVRQWHLDGIDVDWEAPQSEAQWRLLANFLNDFRRLWSKSEERHTPTLMLSFTLWPHDLNNMLAAKSGKKTLADVADRVHLMTYSGDETHAVQKWKEAHLPLNRLAFGVRFFLEGGTPYYDLAQADVIGTKGKRERDRVKQAGSYASSHGLAGIFVWEVGQDQAASKEHSLLQSLQKGIRAGADRQDL
eukprot:TRINITY_DN39074_c0_g1_i1.p1 TRINITY_DN39074_c0_g1~~TRINITY_DN39074_c0_g1_i1.p1  ORF type:complete len:304 (-),score=52.31 TRINITY_DN39074_c0_g1_i1:306-1217(-)